MSGNVKITDKDFGYTRFEFDLKELAKRQIHVGLMGDGSVEGVAVVDYAMYNEFGTSTIPPRPFMSKTYELYGDKTNKLVERLYNKIIEGEMNPDHLLQVVGADYQSKIQKTIRDAKNWAVPNLPETIARKGSSSPLIDTGTMVGFVRYEID